MQISYYLKQKIINQVVNVVMIIFLILTLFPIGWMIYSSVKENTDILVGKVNLSRAKNVCRAIDVDEKNIYICTADGGINKFDKATSRPESYVSMRTSSTNFAFDKNYIWVSSANRGLIRINRDNLKEQKKFRLPLHDVDISKVSDTMLIRDDEYLWFSMRYKGFEGIFGFKVSEGKVTKVYDLSSELSPFQIISTIKAGNRFWVGTDKALFEVDSGDGRVLNSFPTSYLMPEGITRIVSFDGKLLLGSSTGLFYFSPQSLRVLRKYDQDSGLISGRIESLSVRGNSVLIGTNAGLSILSPLTGEIKNFSLLFNPIIRNEEVAPGGLTPDIVTAIRVEDSSILLGSTAGRVSRLDPGSGKITESFVGRVGHLVIAWRNYIDMWKNINFGLYLRNSLIICGATMFFSMVLATLAAYAISRFKFPGAGLFSMSILATQMIPGIMFLIPIYIMFIKFTEFTGIPLKGTFFGIIFIYTAFNVPFSIWILRGFFAAIPIELEEAARIDGCNPLQVFWYIVLPLAMPGIIATGVYIFLTAWDELMFAWVLTGADTMTIPVGIRNFVGNYQNRFDLMMAAATVATVPVTILFFMLQKYIVRGLTAGAVKG